MSKIKNSVLKVRLPIIIAIAIAVGMLVGATMGNKNQSSGDVSKGALKFREVLTYINRDYVDTVDVNHLVETGIKNMLGELDPHSVYINAEDKTLANSELGVTNTSP